MLFERKYQHDENVHLVFFTPDEFVKLTGRILPPDEDKAEFNGEKFLMALINSDFPMLESDTDGQILSSEGLHRGRAAVRSGIGRIPVAIELIDGDFDGDVVPKPDQDQEYKAKLCTKLRFVLLVHFLKEHQEMSKKGVPLPAKTIESIRNHLRINNLTHEEFARQLKITPKTLNNWLSRRTSVEFSKLDNLVRTLGIGLEDLFEGDIPSEYIFHQETARAAWWLYKSGLATLFHHAYPKSGSTVYGTSQFRTFAQKGFFPSF